MGLLLLLLVIKSLKLYLLQSSPILQIYISVSDSHGVGNIPGIYFVKTLLAVPSHS